MIRMRPSREAAPSMAFRRPLKETLAFVTEQGDNERERARGEGEQENLVGVSGVRSTPEASTSSRRTMPLLGNPAKSIANVSSVRLPAERERA